MLQALTIRDFVIVDKLDLEFSPGFTVLITVAQPFDSRRKVTRSPRRFIRFSILSCLLTAKKLGVDQVAQAMDRQQMDLLDACGDVGRYPDFDIFGKQQRSHAATVSSG